VIRFRITHPFHPLRGTEYDLVARRTNWGEDRVFIYDTEGTLKSLPASVTDVVPVDAFTHISAGRSAFRVDDLLALRELLDHQAGAQGAARDV
jgi:hypothetical protein